jgi:hypothetical protein
LYLTIGGTNAPFQARGEISFSGCAFFIDWLNNSRVYKSGLCYSLAGLLSLLTLINIVQKQQQKRKMSSVEHKKARSKNRGLLCRAVNLSANGPITGKSIMQVESGSSAQ